MSAVFQMLIILLLLNNFALLGIKRLATLIRFVAVQGMLLALLLLPPLTGTSFSLEQLVLAMAVLLIKGFSLPWLLRRTFRNIMVGTLVQPRLGYGLSVVLGMASLVFSLWLEGKLPVAATIFPPLLLPAALTTLCTGFILIITRIKALTQVIGYLVAENGIFLLGIPLMEAGAVWFEMTILLDVFVAVFVMGIAINHINHTFESTDVGRFCSLRD